MCYINKAYFHIKFCERKGHCFDINALLVRWRVLRSQTKYSGGVLFYCGLPGYLSETGSQASGQRPGRFSAMASKQGELDASTGMRQP